MLGGPRFLIEVDASMEALLSTEDLDGDGRITIDDPGPKVKRRNLYYKALARNR